MEFPTLLKTRLDLDIYRYKRVDRRTQVELHFINVRPNMVDTITKRDEIRVLV